MKGDLMPGLPVGAIAGFVAGLLGVGAALGAWLATERLRANPLKRGIARVLLAFAVKTVWGLI